MEHQSLIKLIKSYSTISSYEEELIKKIFISQKIKKKEILIYENSPCNKLFFVNTGLLRAFYTNEKGNEITRMIAWENRFMTNIINFRNFSENNETIECIKDAQILYITRENFDLLMQNSNNLKCIYADILEKYTSSLIERFRHITTSNINSKLEHLKNDYPNLINKVNDGILASFLGITRETFARHKKNL